MRAQIRKNALLTSMLTVGLAAPLHAATDVSSDSTTPLTTSSAGDITVNEDISLDVDGASPITVNSNNSVSIAEDSTVQADDADGRSGIAVAAGTTFDISNAGSLLVTEDFVPEDGDSNGVADGAIAQASNRYGIHVLPGATTTGTIDNSGTIGVEGLNSYGIGIESPFTGNIVNSGTITAIGDYSTAISTADVTGNVTVDGTVTAVGEGSRAVAIDGDLSGTLSIQGTVSRGSAYTDDDGDMLSLSRSDLRVFAPTVSVAGNVDGGILVANAPYDLDSDNDDEDGDGVDDADEATGSITAIGESPALLIGGTDDIAIGGVAGRDDTYSLAVDGDINANGTYSAFTATAVEIGGQGGKVDLPDGIGVSGWIKATTYDSEATAILIDADATVPTLYNSGEIYAYVTSSGEAELTAIKDLSGTLATIDNTGHIAAAGSNEDLNVAIDLQNNTSGVTISQYLNSMDADAQAEEEADEDYDASSATVYTSITGNILTGSGNDTISVSSGYISGNAYLGAGDDSVILSDEGNYAGEIHAGDGAFALALSDDATFTGTLDAAGQAASVTLAGNAKFTGSFENADKTSVKVSGGTLQAAAGKVATFDTLDVGADGSISVVIDGDDGTASSFAVNDATFADGATVKAQITSLANAAGTYTILTAGNLTGAPTWDSTAADLPLLFTGSVTTNANSIDLAVHLKTADELGLTCNQSEAYAAILAATANSSGLEEVLVQESDLATLQGDFEELLPDHAGGVFDFVSRTARAGARHVSDDAAVFKEWPSGVWLQPYYFAGSKDTGGTIGFRDHGMGFTGGFENDFGFGYLGLSGNFATGRIRTSSSQSVKAHALEVGLHWRLRTGKFYSFARVSAILASMHSSRTFTGTVDDTDYTDSTAGKWDGKGVTGTAGFAYDADLTEAFTLRPAARLDYLKFKEDSYEESGGSFVDLTVNSRTSDALTGTGSVTASYRLGSRQRDGSTPLTFELEGGYRSVLSGSLGATTAAFEDGDEFVLTPDALKGGWLSEARFLAGGPDYTWQIGVGAEKTQGDVDLSARASFSFGF
jgi:hypothetical protein